MPRGQLASVGDETINANGYLTVKIANGIWKTKAQVLMEQHIGRSLGPLEYVDMTKTDKANPKLEELTLRIRADKKSPKARLIELEEELREHQSIVEALQEQISKLKTEI